MEKKIMVNVLSNVTCPIYLAFFLDETDLQNTCRSSKSCYETYVSFLISSKIETSILRRFNKLPSKLVEISNLSIIPSNLRESLNKPARTMQGLRNIWALWELVRIQWQSTGRCLHHSSHCLCGSYIVRNFEIQNVHTKQVCVIGSECINYFHKDTHKNLHELIKNFEKALCSCIVCEQKFLSMENMQKVKTKEFKEAKKMFKTYQNGWVLKKYIQFVKCPNCTFKKCTKCNERDVTCWQRSEKFKNTGILNKSITICRKCKKQEDHVKEQEQKAKQEEDELKEKESLKYVLTFGKHRGKTLEDLISSVYGRNYLNWLYNAKETNLSSSTTKDLDMVLLQEIQTVFKITNHTLLPTEPTKPKSYKKSRYSKRQKF